MDDMHQVAQTTDYVREETWSRDDRLQGVFAFERKTRKSKIGIMDEMNGKTTVYMVSLHLSLDRC